MEFSPGKRPLDAFKAFFTIPVFTCYIQIGLGVLNALSSSLSECTSCDKVHDGQQMWSEEFTQWQQYPSGFPLNYAHFFYLILKWHPAGTLASTQWLQGVTSAGTRPPDGSLLDFVAGDGAAVGFGAGHHLGALLHPLHHQVQQGGHRLVHVHTRHRARFKVRDAAGERQRSQSYFARLHDSQAWGSEAIQHLVGVQKIKTLQSRS